MQAISDFFTWLFTNKTGVIFLVIGGILLCLVIAVVMERKTKQTYFEHRRPTTTGPSSTTMTRTRTSSHHAAHPSTQKRPARRTHFSPGALFGAERGLAHRKRPPTGGGGLSNSWCGRKDLNLHEIALIRT